MHRLRRILFWVTPALTIFVVGFALFVVGAPRVQPIARLWGGPVSGTGPLIWRVEAAQWLEEREVPLAGTSLQVLWRVNGSEAARTLRLDDQGEAFVELPRPPLGQLHVEVSREDGQTLASGELGSVSASHWLGQARRRGGWIDGITRGELQIRVAAERGVLAVPFTETLLVEVRDQGKPSRGARVEAELDGTVPERVQQTTDAEGRAKLQVAPRHHVASLGLRACKAGTCGSFHCQLPVIPGALWASLKGSTLSIQSATPNERAQYTIIGEKGRVAAGQVQLRAERAGSHKARVHLPGLPQGPLWAVVGSESGLDSRSSVGWPLRPELSDEPFQTLDVPDRLLLDGRERARQAESRRQRLAQAIAIVAALAGFALMALLLLEGGRRAHRQIYEHLARAGASHPEELVSEKSTRSALAVGFLCLLLGFALIALIAVYRLG